MGAPPPPPPPLFDTGGPSCFNPLNLHDCLFHAPNSSSFSGQTSSGPLQQARGEMSSEPREKEKAEATVHASMGVVQGNEPPFSACMMTPPHLTSVTAGNCPHLFFPGSHLTNLTFPQNGAALAYKNFITVHKDKFSLVTLPNKCMGHNLLNLPEGGLFHSRYLGNLRSSSEFGTCSATEKQSDNTIVVIINVRCPTAMDANSYGGHFCGATIITVGRRTTMVANDTSNDGKPGVQTSQPRWHQMRSRNSTKTEKIYSN